MSAYLQNVRLFSRDVWLYLLSSVFVGFSYLGISIVLFNLYLLRLGYGPEFIGLLFAIGALSFAVFSLPAGVIGRRWGIRPTLILGMVVMTVGAGLIPCTEWLPKAWWSPWLQVANAISWVGAAIYLASTPPFLAGASGDAERGHVFSAWMGLLPLAGFAGGMVAGRLPALFAGWLGLPLDSPTPYRYPQWIAFALYVVALLPLLATRKVGVLNAPATEREGGGRAAPWGLIGVVGVVALLRQASGGAMTNFFNVYLDADLRLPTTFVGTLMAAGQLLGAAAAFAAPILMARYGKGRTYILACLGLALGYLPLALVPHWAAAGIGGALIWTMSSIADPTFNVFGQEAVSPGWRPAVSGAITMAQGLGWALAGLGGGRAITALGYGPTFLLAAALPVGAAGLFWAYFRVPRSEAAGAPAAEAGG